MSIVVLFAHLLVAPVVSAAEGTPEWSPRTSHPPHLARTMRIGCFFVQRFLQAIRDSQFLRQVLALQISHRMFDTN